MINIDWAILGGYFTVLAFLIPLIIVVTNWIIEYYGIKSKGKKRAEIYKSFEAVVKDLSSDNPVAQLSAAILLRQFFNVKIGKEYYLYKETMDVISAILRTLPIGVYQKTIADGLAYTNNLSKADLQRTNLQNVYLGSKSHVLDLSLTDFYMANLSYSLIDNVKANNVILYNAILFNASIKNSDFTDANFRGADLTGIKFSNVILKGAVFKNAINVPEDIQENIKDGIYQSIEPFTTTNKKQSKTIFFSMPGSMSKSDEITISAYLNYITKLGFDVLYYNRDTYPRFGQLSQIKLAMEKSVALIAFGTKQTLIKQGTYRPGMVGEYNIENSWFSTPWNEIEVGMAVMRGIPILLVKDTDIEMGIFDNVLSESFILTLDSHTDTKELDRNPVVKDWLSRFM